MRALSDRLRLRAGLRGSVRERPLTTRSLHVCPNMGLGPLATSVLWLAVCARRCRLLVWRVEGVGPVGAIARTSY